MSTGLDPIGEPFNPSTYTASTQTQIHTLALNDGGALMFWATRTGVASFYEIRAQRFAADGTPIGVEFAVNVPNTSINLQPSGTVLEDGSLVVVWNTRNQANQTGVFGRHLSESGEPIGGEIVILPIAASQSAPYPLVLAQEGGGFVTVWVQPSGSTYRLRGQFFDETGAPNGNSVNWLSSGYLDVKDAVPLPGGGFAIFTLTGTGFVQRRFNENGALTGTSTVVDDPNFTSAGVSAEVLPDGSILTTYSLYRTDGSEIPDLFVQRLNAAGTPVGTPIPINSETAPPTGLGQAPKIAVLDDGGFVVVWETNSSPGDDEVTIYGRRFNAAGEPVGQEVVIEGGGGLFRYWLDIGVLDDNGFVVSWQFNLPGLDSDVHVQFFRSEFFGTSGADSLSGSEGANAMYGEAGNDTIVGGDGADTLNGGDGFDTASYADSDAAVSVSLDTNQAGGGDADGDVLIRIENLEGSAFADTLTGSDGRNAILGGAGNDNIRGLRGGDTIEGGEGNDTINGDHDGDLLFGGIGNDQVGGGNGNDTVYGGDGNDTVSGGNDHDHVYGEAGNDVVSGGKGNDFLFGGLGRDTMSGGVGADDFVFLAAAETGTGSARDVITDFQSGTDDIDLSAFMSGGAFIDAAAFSGTAGEVRYIVSSGILSGDVDGDGVTDWQLNILNKADLTADDFIF